MSQNNPVIKWTGSKRSQAKEICNLIPKDYSIYFEPFLGGGSILYHLSPNNAIVSDISTPLIKFFSILKNNPQQLIDSYYHDWNILQDDNEYYYEVRKRFNENQSATDFLFLSRTCINGLIRFNKKGDFNSPFHIGRPGINPKTLEKIIILWHEKFKNYIFINCDYSNIIDNFITKNDFIYLDPPYFETKGMYHNGLDFNNLCKNIEKINLIGAKYILSYDGINGKDNTVSIPKELYKEHHYLNSGNSSFSRLFSGKNINVLESIYKNY